METTPEKNMKVESTPRWAWMILVIVCLLIALIGWISSCNKEEKSPSSSTIDNSNGTPTEVLQLVAVDSVGPGAGWTTPKIDYKFKIRTEGHAINLQFSGDNGTWLTPVPYPPEGDFSMPPEARPGQVNVTAGPNETRKFRAQLYKIISVLLH